MFHSLELIGSGIFLSREQWGNTVCFKLSNPTGNLENPEKAHPDLESQVTELRIEPGNQGYSTIHNHLQPNLYRLHLNPYIYDHKPDNMTFIAKQ